jgi:carbamate kinase
MARLVIYAIGGNALSSPTGSDEKQSALVLAKVLSDVIDLLEGGWRVILTHGNGPQVGRLLTLDAENDQGMDSWVAATQGMIGHELSIHLDSILYRRQRPERTAVILTRVEVAADDPGFKIPSKPVGPILSNDAVFANEWDVAETIDGPRRVVASPNPLKLLDIDVISQLVDLRAVVICCGGGGIPVIRHGNEWLGIPAVVDKDRVSALLAIELKADALIISTAVDGLRTDFGLDTEVAHPCMSLAVAKDFMEEGQFPPGSMGPKVSSLIDAVEMSPSLKAIICQPGDAIAALRGDAGTIIGNVIE